MRVCVFCGSSDGTSPAYRAAASGVGRLLAARGIGVVYGGGRAGCMGALADAALAAGGEVIGVLPHALEQRELAHTKLSALHIVSTLHERKAQMTSLADAFLALPGGFGTLDELFEALTWRQLGYHDKPVALLDVDGYYASLLAFCDSAARHGFLRLIDRAALLSGDDPERLIDDLIRAAPATSGA
jgi:uncharacterized protein (TIGR00730 family)